MSAILHAAVHCSLSGLGPMGGGGIFQKQGKALSMSNKRTLHLNSLWSQSALVSEIPVVLFLSGH